MHEIFYLVSGVALGVIVAYALLAKRLVNASSSRAKQVAEQLFASQKSMLEASIRQEYVSRFETWKATDLLETVHRERSDAIDRARSVLKGKIGEQLAPMLPEFLSQYNPSEARFLGSPVDYIVFNNLSSEEASMPVEVVLIDVKTGDSNLSKNQKRIEAAIQSGRVRFETLRLAMPYESKSG